LPYEILQADKLKFIGGMAALNNNSNGKQQHPEDEVQFSVAFAFKHFSFFDVLYKNKSHFLTESEM
jgi:hypothetical protein